MTQAIAAQSMTFSDPKRLATLNHAFNLHEQAEFEQSYQQFSELMRLGNGRASAQLGLMTLAEEGTGYDPVRAWAYFQHAGDLGFANGYGLAAEVYDQLPAEQQQATSTALGSLSADMQITHRNVRTFRDPHLKRGEVTPQRRRPPRYPDNLVHRGEVGYTLIALLIDTNGRVAAYESLFSSNPEFARSSVRSLSNWRYEPPKVPVLRIVRMDFEMRREGDVREPYIQVIQDLTWARATAGNPAFQSAQAVYLDYIVPSQRVTPKIQDDKFVERAPNADDLDQLKESDIEENGKAERNWPLNWTSGYWFQQAAESGEHTAQRILAHGHDEWESYLIDAGDARAAAWAAARWLQQDDVPDIYEKGLRYLEYLQGSDDRVVSDIVTTLREHHLGD